MALTDWTTDPYPKARSKRSVPAGTPEPAAGMEPARAPRTRFWSQRIKIATNQIARLSSPRFLGPAILKDLTGSCVAGATSVPIEILVQLLVAGAPQTDTAIAGQVLVTSGVNISDTSAIDSTIATAYTNHDGFIWRWDGTAAQMFTQPLDYVVYDAEFWLAIVLRNPHTTNGMTLDATVRLYEQCDIERLPLLMS